MKKFCTLGLVLLSVVAFGAIAAGSAFAESEFLVGGVDARAGEPAHNEGELTLIALNQTFFKVEVRVRCSILTEGTFLGFNDIELTKVFDLAEKRLTELETTGVPEKCVNVANCPEPLVYPENLSWLVEIVLDSPTSLLIHLTGSNKGEPRYETDCMGVGLTYACAGLASGTFVNNATDFDTTFLQAEEEAAGEGGSCSEGGPSYIEGTLLTSEVNGKSIAVS